MGDERKRNNGCLTRLVVGGCASIFLGMLMIAIWFGAVIGGGNTEGWELPNYAPGEPAPGMSANPPCLCSPTPVHTPTPLPSATPLPTWPLPPTPNPGQEPEPPTVPTEVPPADATATWQAYEGEHEAWAATATMQVVHWQQTVVAAQATQTALIPTRTPPPPTPIGGGPYGWPVNKFCRGYDGCASGSDDIRLTTQDYGCTDYPEWPCPWCHDPTHAVDHRYHANGSLRNDEEHWKWWHRGIDMDTGVGEAYWATLDGYVVVARDSGDLAHGFGRYLVIRDASGIYQVIYGHMSRMGDAVDVRTGASLERVWQVGDRIRPYTDAHQHIIVGYSGCTGYCSGPHIHYQVERLGRQANVDVDPVPYMNRNSPSDLLPDDDPPYGYLAPRTWLVAAATLSDVAAVSDLYFAPPAANSRQLKVAVRDTRGVGVWGMKVTAYRSDELNPPVKQAEAETDKDGVASFAVTGWPNTIYIFHFAAGSSGRGVEGETAQKQHDPPLSMQLWGSDDEVMTFILGNEGRLAVDYSYDLKSTPVQLPANRPTPAPLTWAQVLARRGISYATPEPAATVTTPPNPPDTKVAATANSPRKSKPGNINWLVMLLGLALLSGGVVWLGLSGRSSEQGAVGIGVSDAVKSLISVNIGKRGKADD